MLVDARFYDARCPGNRIIFDLADGRSVEVPIEWFPLLQAAPKDARDAFEIVDDGRVMAWPELGERVSVVAVLLIDGPASSHLVPMPGSWERGSCAERAEEVTHTGTHG